MDLTTINGTGRNKINEPYQSRRCGEKWRCVLDRHFGQRTDAGDVTKAAAANRSRWNCDRRFRTRTTTRISKEANVQTRLPFFKKRKKILNGFHWERIIKNQSDFHKYHETRKLLLVEFLDHK